MYFRFYFSPRISISLFLKVVTQAPSMVVSEVSISVGQKGTELRRWFGTMDCINSSTGMFEKVKCS